MARAYTYIVECLSVAKKDTTVQRKPARVITPSISYYVGSTNNLRRRITEHIAGRGAKYLRGRAILRVIYASGFHYPETYIKNYWTHEKKAAFMDHTFTAGEWPPGYEKWRPAWRRCETCNGSGDYIMNREPIGYWRDDCRDCNGTGGEWLLEENR